AICSFHKLLNFIKYFPLSLALLQGECSAGTLPVAWVDEGPGPPKCHKSCKSENDKKDDDDDDEKEEETPLTDKLNKNKMSNTNNTNNSSNNNKHKNKKDNKINIKLVGYTSTTNTFNIKLRNSQPTISHSSNNGDTDGVGGDVIRDKATKDSSKQDNRKSKQQQQQSHKLFNPFNYYQIHKNYNNNYSKMTKTRRNSNENRPQIARTTTTTTTSMADKAIAGAATSDAAAASAALVSKTTSASSSPFSSLPAAAAAAESSTTVELATGKTKAQTSANMTNANENTTNILDATITHTDTQHQYSDDIYEFMHKMQQDAAAHSDTDGVEDIVADDDDDNGDGEEDEEDTDDDIDHNVHNDAAVADNAAFAMQLQQFQQQQQQYHHNNQPTPQNQANNNIVKMKLTATTAGASSRSASQQFQLKYNRLQSDLNENNNNNNNNNNNGGNGGGGNNNNNNKRHHHSYQLQIQDVPDFSNNNNNNNHDSNNNNYGAGQQQRLAYVNSNSYGSSSNSISDVFPATEQKHQRQQHPQQQCLDYLGDSAETTPTHLCTHLTSPSQLLAQLRHLRLRNCCERNVYSALHTLALNVTLSGGKSCIRILEDLIELDALASRITCGLSEILFRFDCRQVYSIIHQCEDCKEAYRRWVCSTLVPYFAEPNDVIKPPEIYETTTDSGQYPHKLHQHGQQAGQQNTYQTAVESDGSNQRATNALNTKSSDNNGNNNNKSPTSYTTSSSSGSSSNNSNNNHSNNTNMASNMTTSHLTITTATTNTTTTHSHSNNNNNNDSNNTKVSSTKLTKRAAVAATTTSNYITAKTTTTTVNSNNNNYDDIQAHLHWQHKEQQPMQHTTYSNNNNNNNRHHHVKRRSTQQQHINAKQFNDKLNSNYIPNDNALHKRPSPQTTNNTPRPPPPRRAASSSDSDTESATVSSAAMSNASAAVAVAAITTTPPPTLTRKTQALTFNDVIFVNKTTTTTTTSMRTTTTTGHSFAARRRSPSNGDGDDDNTASGLNSSVQHYNNKSTNKRRKRNDDTTTSVYIGDNKPNLAEHARNGEEELQDDDDDDNNEQQMLKHHHRQNQQTNNSKIVAKQPQLQHKKQQQQKQQSINFITTANSEDSLFDKDPVISKLLKRSKRKVEFRKRRRIRPCLSVCQTVEQKCPYLLPADRAPAMQTQYAGEPTFLCLDYNIAETEEQLRKASHGPNECCYTYCQTAADGICTYCNEFLDAKDIEMEAERITKEKGKRLYNITLKAREEKALRVEAKIQQQLAPVATENVAAGGHLKMSTVAIVVRNDTLAMNVTRLAERLPYYAYCDGVYYYDEDVDDMPAMAYSDDCPALPTVQSRCRIPYWATNYETSGEDWGSYRRHGEAQKLMVWLSSLLCLWSCYTARALRLQRKQEKRPKQNQQQQQQPQQINNNNTAFERGINENRCRNCENREIMLMNVNNYLTKDGRRKSRRARVNVWYDISENRILIICILSGTGGGGGAEVDNKGGLLPKARGNEVSRLRGQKEKLMNFRELVRRRQQIDLLYSKNALILLIHYTNRLKSFMQQAQPHRKRKLTHLRGGWYWWARQHACQSQIPRIIKLKMKLMYKRLMMSLGVRRRKLIRIAKKKKKQKQQKMTETEDMNCSNVSISHCSCSLISCSCNGINKKYN
uniref:Uncharacterized protein n=1 Tax=Musca domestica TaxID=7370 RepID=A0A1I8M2H8_MUSDO